MIRVVELEQTCDACPSQWEGRTEDGGFVYVRYRWGALQVGFGPTLSEAVGDRRLYRVLSDSLHGELSYPEMIAATRDVVDWPLTHLAADGTTTP